MQTSKETGLAIEMLWRMEFKAKNSSDKRVQSTPICKSNEPYVPDMKYVFKKYDIFKLL